MSLVEALLVEVGDRVHSALTARAAKATSPRTGEAALVLDTYMMKGCRKYKPALGAHLDVLTTKGPGGTRYYANRSQHVLDVAGDLMGRAAQADASSRMPADAPPGICSILVASEEGLAVLPTLVCEGLTDAEVNVAMLWLACRHEPTILGLAREHLEKTGSIEGHVGVILAIATPPISSSVCRAEVLQQLPVMQEGQAKDLLDAMQKQGGILPMIVVTPRGVMMSAKPVAAWGGEA